MHVQNSEYKPRVILLGTSLLMESVANSLSIKGDMEVIHMEFSPVEIAKSFASSKPDMIIFELGHTQSYPLLSLVKDQSDVLILGLDLTSCQVIVLNTHLRLTRSMDELYKAVVDELNI